MLKWRNVLELEKIYLSLLKLKCHHFEKQLSYLVLNSVLLFYILNP